MQNPYQPLTEPSGDQGGGIAAVKDEATSHASELKDTAAEKVGELASEAKDKATSIAQEAKSQLSSAASQQEDRAVQFVRTGAEQLRSLAQGDTTQAGPFIGYVEQLASRVDGLAESFERKGVSGVVRDVERYARRRPLVFLGGCFLTGLTIGRIARNATPPSNGAAGELPATTGYGSTYGEGMLHAPETGLGGTSAGTTGYGTTGTGYGAPATGTGYGAPPTGTGYGTTGSGYGTGGSGYGTPGTGTYGGATGGDTGSQEPYPASTGSAWPAPGSTGGQA